MMDEINEKAIKDIIDYYDKKEKEELNNEPEKKSEDEAPDLVELIAEAQKEKNISPVIEQIDTPKIISIETEIKSEKTAVPENQEQTSEEADIPENQKQISEEADIPENQKQISEEADIPEDQEQTSEETDIPENQEQINKDAEKPEEKTEDAKKSVLANQEEINKSDEDTDREEAEKRASEAALAALGDIELTDYDDDYHFTKKQIVTISIVTLIVMALVIVFVTVDTGFIGSYKHNFSQNISAVFAKLGIDFSSNDDTQTENSTAIETENYTASTKGSVTIPIEKAGESVFSTYRGGIVCANSNYLSLIDSDGNLIWENTTTIVDPILKADGNYILLAEKGGKKICLYNDSRLVYEVDTEDNILSCNLSSNGDAVVITDKSAYKGSVIVYNKDGNQIFAWSSGSDNIISADISASSRRVAVSLLNTDAQVKTTVQFFDVKKTESYAQLVFEDTILFDIDFIGDTISAFGDNCIAGMTSNGAVLYNKQFENAEFVHYSVDDKGNKILLFDASNIPLINIYNSSDTLKQQLSSDEIPDFVDIYGNYIIFNSGRDIIYGKCGSRQMAEFTASMDIKKLMLLDKNIIAVVYSNSIEIVRM